MVRNAILTWASGEAFCKSEGFRCYVKSLDNIKDADRYVFTHDMADDVRQELVDKVTIVDVDPARIHYLLRDRHLIFWEFLIKNKVQYKHVVITDSKDVVFQRDIFNYVDGHWFDYLHLAGEGMTHKQSGWNLIDQFEAQRNVREFQKEYREWPVINGGVMMGTNNMLSNMLFLLWSNTVRSIGKNTDQGILNYLYSYLQDTGPIFLKEPQRHAFCLTGEAVKEGFVKPLFKDGMFYLPITEEPYYIVHQWERTTYKDELLAHYLK
jgi:hypothetical protein